MKRTLVALTMTSVLSLGLAGCSSDDDDTTSDPTTSASQSTDSTTDAMTDDAMDDMTDDATDDTTDGDMVMQEEVADALLAFNQSMIDNASADNQAFETARAGSKEAADVANAGREAFADTFAFYNGSESLGDDEAAMIAISVWASGSIFALVGEDNIQVEIDPEQVVVDGDNAMVPASAQLVTVEGETMPVDDANGDMNLVKSSDGTWLLDTEKMFEGGLTDQLDMLLDMLP
jgi:hypothetical protein